MSSEAALAAVNRGSLEEIFRTKSDGITPIVQCVQVKALDTVAAGGQERFRVVFSDVNNFVQSMLASQKNSIIKEGHLVKGCFVRLKQYQPNSLKGKRILIVLDLEVLTELGIHEKLGEPKALEIKGEDDASTATAAVGASTFYGNDNTNASRQGGTTSSSKPAGNSTSTGHRNLTPIEMVTPFSHKWTIKARCTSKSAIKTWHNKNGEGKLFSVNFLDESGEIRGTGFNDQCDALYDVFQEGSVYYISNPCKVNMAKKQFSNLSNDYELMFERDTLVEKAEEQSGVPQIRFNFITIAELQNAEKDTTCDIIGVLNNVGETSQIVSKTTSKPYDKRELTLVDNSGYSVRLTIWGNTATQFDVKDDSVIAFKGVKISDFGGRSLSLLSSGSMTVDPDINEAHKLKGWYLAQGKNDTFMSHAQMATSTGLAGGRTDAFKTIAQIKDEGLGTNEEPDYFAVKATIIYIKQDNIAYPACLSEGCNKKVVETDPGRWRCEKCDKTHPKPEYRYIMSINVSDHTGQLWLNAFDDSGRVILGKSGDEVMELRDSDNTAAEAVFHDANCKSFVFRCRAKMDTYQDNQRVRYQITNIAELNFVTESQKLIEAIKQYSLA